LTDHDECAEQQLERAEDRDASGLLMDGISCAIEQFRLVVWMAVLEMDSRT
jgi:hypothetical protein